MVGDVRVADVLEEERSIVAGEPACEGEEELAEGRMDVEEVGTLEVVRGKLRDVVVSNA